MTDKERIIMDAFKAKLEGNDKELEKAILALREYAKKDLGENDADLEEAAYAYNEEYSKYLCGLNTAFKAGANWMKKKMEEEHIRRTSNDNKRSY